MFIVQNPQGIVSKFATREEAEKVVKANKGFKLFEPAIGDATGSIAIQETPDEEKRQEEVLEVQEPTPKRRYQRKA